MNNARILIVHPEPPVVALMTSMLQTLGHRIDEASSDRAAVRMLEHSPADLILAGVEPTDPDALEFLAYLRRKHPRTPVILLFPAPQPERAREALHRGAAAVLRFPIPATQLRASVAQCLGEHEESCAPGPAGARPRQRQRERPREPCPFVGPRRGVARERPGDGPDRGPRLGAGVGADDPGRRGSGPPPDPRTRQDDRPEPGPGPDPRRAGDRQDDGGPHPARSGAAGRRPVPHPVLRRPEGGGPGGRAVREEGGATGDLGPDRPGKIAQAAKGTLYLEDVAELSPGLQYKLLRVLQDGSYEPVGSTQTMKADVRIILGTRVDLAPLVEQGLFRQDLFYRISVVALKLPPLRHRGPDIDRLADHFRARFAREQGNDVRGFTAEALELLRRHDWPGNVHELRNAVERGVVLCRGGMVEAAHLALVSREARASRPGSSPSRPHLAMSIRPLKEALEEPEKQIILQALEALSWNRQETARVLDINRTTLYKKMKKYGLLFDEPAWVN